MDTGFQLNWHPVLQDPTRIRCGKPRTCGKTMVIDKGLGLHALEDLLQTGAAHIDYLKIGFGTAPLYPTGLLRQKIELAGQYGVSIYPGGTFLEVAISEYLVDDYFQTVRELGFSAVEISDGTIEIDRNLRSELILRALDEGLTVLTEYGKKCWGSAIEVEELIRTVLIDSELGAEAVIIEGRESGAGVGIYDENGACKDGDVRAVLSRLPNPYVLMWETPQKSQQIHLMRMLGTDLNLGNIAPGDLLSLEALRRGLRSDTFGIGRAAAPVAEDGQPSR